MYAEISLYFKNDLKDQIYIFLKHFISHKIFITIKLKFFHTALVINLNLCIDICAYPEIMIVKDIYIFTIVKIFIR